MSISVREVKNKKDRNKIPTHRPGTVYDVNIKYKCEDGTYKTYGKRGFYSKADAIAHEAEMRVKLNDSYYQTGYLKYNQSTLAIYLTDWLEDYAFRYVSPNTYNGYRININNHIIPAIGHVKLRSVTAKVIDDLCAAMIDNGYAQATVRYMYRTLSVSLEHAKKHRYIESNPVRDTFTKFKGTRDIPLPYDVSEMKCLLENVTDAKWKFIIILAGLYGLRRGEVFGLRIGDIDLDKRQFKVAQQLSSRIEFERSGKYTAALKVKSSIRTLPITDRTFLYFQEQVEQHTKKSKNFKDACKDIGIVICKSSGEPYKAAHTSEGFHSILDKLRMRRIRFHDLRRSTSTNMHELTGDYYTTGEILGHTLKGIGISLGISEGLQNMTSKYIDIRLKRKTILLEAYHKEVLGDLE